MYENYGQGNSQNRSSNTGIAIALSLLGIITTGVITGFLLNSVKSKKDHMVLYSSESEDSFNGVSKSRPKNRRRLSKRSERSPLKRANQSTTTKRKAADSPPNIHLQILPNSGGGDCLFYCFQQALDEWLGYNSSHGVQNLRQIVSNAVNEEHLEHLQTVFAAAEALTSEGDHSFEVMQLYQDYMFMKDVKTVDDLKKIVLTTVYWGDEFAIRVLEEHTGIQTIIIKPVDRHASNSLHRKGNFELAHKIGEREQDPKIIWKPHILLLLKDQHYQLAQLNGRILQTATNLPVFLQPQYARNLTKQITLRPVPVSPLATPESSDDDPPDSGDEDKRAEIVRRPLIKNMVKQYRKQGAMKRDSANEA